MALASCDVVVIGGGPGGSTVASVVTMQGHRVVLLEKQRFPRHQIGESLLPSTVHGVCRLLGLDKELARAGFQRKRGGTFLWGKSTVPWTFTFSSSPESPTGFAYQVERAKFDALLLRHAAKLGVDVREESAVTDVVFDGERAAGVTYRDSQGDVHRVDARFVVDAGGAQSPFYRLVGQRLFSKFFTNVALYAYFTDGKRLPSPNAGNILCAAFSDGWFWYIPLSDDLTSVGAVVAKSHVAAIQQGREQAFCSFVSRCPLIKEYLSKAVRVTDGPYGEFRVRKDYSYSNTAFHRNGLVLVGDSACFVDPVLSSGVHLATYAALLAGRSINTCLDGRLSERVCFDEFEFRYRREFGNFYEFLAAFYDMHQDEASYYWKARKVLNVDASPKDAFVTLVGGLADRDEPAFENGSCLAAPSHGGLADWFESAVSRPRGTSPSRENASSEIEAFAFDRFVPGLSTEMTQVQLQALLGRRRPPDSALTAGGLIPSRDGFHWATPATPT